MAELPVVIKTFSEDAHYDTIVMVLQPETDNVEHFELIDPFYAEFYNQIQLYKQFDKTVEKDGCLIVLPKEYGCRRLIYSPTGSIYRDYDDVRRFYDAGNKGVKRAISAGAKDILVFTPMLERIKKQLFNLAEEVAVLGSLDSLYVPIEIRECSSDRRSKAKSIILDKCGANLKLVNAIELGRNVARDIGGSDPERMSPPKVAEYVLDLFNQSSIKVDVIADDKKLNEMFPCFAAVNRGSSAQHSGRVIMLTYEPADTSKIEKTLVLVGKGVCYDTGGHDLKVNGVMLGMHRDKCGAAAVAGFMKTVDTLKPENVRVVASMAMVRNSIGPDAYVSDEIITARSGLRVRVRNTDAEGRMAMVDVLCYLKEEVLKHDYIKPSFMTIATLTGHACLAVGEGYSAIMSNGPAKKAGVPSLIQEAGEKIGDMFEISTIRREDYEFNKGKSEYEDLMQCNTAPSTRTERGHQVPAAFLIQASGLDLHGNDSEKPLCYSHIDIAPSSGPYPGVPTGAPVPALTVAYLHSAKKVVPQ